jgi:hypothetical protein
VQLTFPFCWYVTLCYWVTASRSIGTKLFLMLVCRNEQQASIVAVCLISPNTNTDITITCFFFSLGTWYTTLHYTTLHYTTLHYTTLHDFGHDRREPRIFVTGYWTCGKPFLDQPTNCQLLKSDSAPCTRLLVNLFLSIFSLYFDLLSGLEHLRSFI